MGDRREEVVSIKNNLACSAGVLLGHGRAKVCYKLAIFYPTGHVWFGVRVDGWGRGQGKGEKKYKLHSLTFTSLLISDRQPPPQYRFLSLSSLLLPLQSKMAAKIFVNKLLSTCLPKLLLLCRLTIIWLFFNHIKQIDSMLPWICTVNTWINFCTEHIIPNYQ